jgi:hypothetical protein
MQPTRFLVSLGLVLAVAACAAPSGSGEEDGVDTAEQGKTITPKGARFGLQVNLPPGVTLAYDQYAMNVEARFLPKGAPHDNQASWLQLTFGKPSWVTASEGCVSVRTRAGTTEDCNLHMTSGTTLNVGLTSLGSMFDADILGTPEVKINATGAGRTGSMSSSAWGEKVVIGGDYEVKLGADTYPVHVPDGAKVWSAGLVPNGAMVVTVTPEAVPAAFPNTSQAYAAMRLASGNASTNVTAAQKKLYVLASTTGASTASLSCFGDYVVASQPVAGTWNIPLYRLDIDDVETTGGVKVAGTFVLYRKTASGDWKAFMEPSSGYGASASSPTKRGLDLPAGDYKVVTSYTLAGAAQTPAEDLVTLP